MHTPVRLGVTDGAIDVTSAAVGKVSDSRRGYSVRGASLSALAPKEDILGACPLGAIADILSQSLRYLALKHMMHEAILEPNRT